MKRTVLALMLMLFVAGLSCNGAGGPQELAWFEGHVDLASGRLVVDGLSVPGTDGRAVAVERQGLETRVWNPNLPVDKDGIPDSCANPIGVELRTLPGTTGTGLAACDRDNSFCGQVQMYSCYPDSEIRGAFVELTWISTTVNNAFGAYPHTAPAVGPLGLNGLFGLWQYGNLGPKGTAVRTWKFDNFSGDNYRFRGVVKGDVVPLENPIETVCAGGTDEDSDGRIDCADPDCSEAGNCRGKVELCGEGKDNDADGRIDCDDPDCRDDDACAPVVFSCAGGICTDPATGLEWQQTPAGAQVPWASAILQCQNLDLGGTGWRLPTIAELRSLVRGCPATETGGSCRVTDGCLAQACGSENCEGCTYNGGPVDGCYWPSGLLGQCDMYWSASGVTDMPGWVWLQFFDRGLVAADVDIGSVFLARCVRDGSVPDGDTAPDGDAPPDGDQEAEACTSHAWSTCYLGDVYWYDSCGLPEEKKEECDNCTCPFSGCGLNTQYSFQCDSNDIYWYDCHGVRQSLKTDCGACGCVNGQTACAVNNEASYVCNAGDVYWRDCNGFWAAKKEECDACACVGTGCVQNTQHSFQCDAGDVYWYDCHSVRAAKKEECDACACSGTACVQNTQHASACYDGDVYWYDCHGVKQAKKEECGAEGCSEGACQQPDPFPCSGGICTDPVTLLEWQQAGPEVYQSKSWNEAVAYCASLSLGGTGWRLPNISELRSLVRNCGSIETGGECGVVDVCTPCGTGPACLSISGDCYTAADCDPSSCADDGGPTGCYWPAGLTGFCKWYWSSSEIVGLVRAWAVNFDEGYVNYFHTAGNLYVRCVR